MESLYRKYRPQTFDQMVGQGHIVTTLENALESGRIAHAYLFSGPRGTGKTTTARLLAKALLCESGPTAHPDGTCEQCLAVAAGTHPDVYELDAASRTGVDNVRDEIINRVAFAPVRGRYKVYIIDEVHMLSTGAFNALLKTVEEPPEHVVFVLCTTNPQKVPDTILSRCQRLEFRAISEKDIEGRLKQVCEREGFSYDEGAVALVARHANGGMRDALSTLEQLSVFGGGKILLEDAEGVLGEVPDDALEKMARLIAARDVAGCFSQVEDLVERGADLSQYASDLARYARDVYVASVAGEAAFEDASKGAALKAVAGALGSADRAAFILDTLGRLESEMRSTADQRLALEVALTRMARPASDLTLESLAARVADLEREVAVLRAGAPAPAASAPAAPAQALAQAAPAAQAQAPAAQPQPQPASAPRFSAPPQAPARPQQAAPFAPVRAASPNQAALGTPSAPAWRQPVQPPQAAAPAAAPETAAAPPPDAGAAQRLWAQTVAEVTKSAPSIGALVQNADGALSADGTLTVVNRGAAFAAQMLARPAHMEALARTASKVYGRPVRVAIAGVGAPGQRPDAASAPGGPAAPSPQPAAQAQRQAAAPAQARTAAQPRQISAAAIAAAAASAVASGSAGLGSSHPVLWQPGGAAPAAAASGPARAAEPPADGAGYEFVPDEVLDAYDESAGEDAPPEADAAAPAPVDLPWGPAAAPAPALRPGPAARPAAQAPAPDARSAPARPAAPQRPRREAPGAPAPSSSAAGGDGAAPQPFDQAAADLAQLLSEGFGGYVKVTDEG